MNTQHTPEYRRFCSYGFLKLYKIQPADGGDRLLQIGSFAGPTAPFDADDLERRDSIGEHRHPNDRTPASAIAKAKGVES